MENGVKIRVTPFLSKQVQNYLFEHGFGWSNDKHELQHVYKPYLLVLFKRFVGPRTEYRRLLWDDDVTCFQEHDVREVKSLEEVKEWIATLPILES